MLERFGPAGDVTVKWLNTTADALAKSVAGVRPQAYVSGKQALAACKEAGKRLCAPVEWRKACMGPREQTFGYGAERIEGRCNDHGRT